MTDRTMGSGSSRMGGDEADLDIDDLFASSGDDGSEDEPTDEKATPEGTGGRDEIEDTTADELFQQLSAEVAEEEDDTVDEADPFEELSDESPEEIIASADEEVEHVDEVDDAIAADDELFDTLLLPEREEEDGFLWVQTEADEEASGDDTAAADDTAPPDSETATAAEQGSSESDLDEDGFSFASDDEASSSQSPSWGDTGQATTDEADEPGTTDPAAEASPEEPEEDDAPEIDSDSTLSATFDEADVSDEDDGTTAPEPATSAESDTETDVEDDDDGEEEALDDPHRPRRRERPLLGVAQPVRLRKYLPENEDDAAGDDGRQYDGDAAGEPVGEEDREDAGDSDVDDVVADEQRHEEAVGIVTELGEDRRATIVRGDAFVEPRPRQREDGDFGTGEEGTRRQQADQRDDAQRRRVEGGHTSRRVDGGKKRRGRRQKVLERGPTILGKWTPSAWK
mgnify:CR=1 FL=1